VGLDNTIMIKEYEREAITEKNRKGRLAGTAAKKISTDRRETLPSAEGGRGLGAHLNFEKKGRKLKEAKVRSAIDTRR